MKRFLLITLLFLDACVDPLAVNVSNEDRRLVVDGFISNQAGPYEVKLFYSNPLMIDRLKSFEPVRQADVFIVDDFGNQYELTEVNPGIYLTNPNELQGELGRSYYLRIVTSDEKEYVSETQKLVESGDIDEVYFEFVPNGLSNNGRQIHELKIFINAKGNSEETNFFRWRWMTTHKTVSNPELHVILTLGGEIPDPESCSGYIFVNGQLVKVDECTCCICWSYNYSEGAYVSPNEYVSESTFNKQFVGSIPVTAMHYYDRYHIRIEQLSLSEKAYDFWALIEKQQKGATDIFQPNTIKIRGNVRSVSDPDEEVLGLFGVSGITSKEVFIDRAIIPVQLPPIQPIPYSCLDYFENPTITQPSFW